MTWTLAEIELDSWEVPRVARRRLARKIERVAMLRGVPVSVDLGLENELLTLELFIDPLKAVSLKERTYQYRVWRIVAPKYSGYYYVESAEIGEDAGRLAAVDTRLIFVKVGSTATHVESYYVSTWTVTNDWNI